jgi:large subunit ribosomal protein L29
MAKASEFREQTDAELSEVADTLRAEIFNARFQKHTEQLEKTSSLSHKRRDLARVLTVLRERDLEKSDA